MLVPPINAQRPPDSNASPTPAFAEMSGTPRQFAHRVAGCHVGRLKMLDFPPPPAPPRKKQKLSSEPWQSFHTGSLYGAVGELLKNREVPPTAVTYGSFDGESTESPSLSVCSRQPSDPESPDAEKIV